MPQATASRSETRVRDQAFVRLRISNTGVASAKVADVLRTPQAQKQLAAVSVIREASMARSKK